MARTRVCDACDGLGYTTPGGQKRTCDNCLGNKYVPLDQPRVEKKK